jgi:hypothetical protein
MPEPEERNEFREKLVSDQGKRLELEDGYSVGWDGDEPTFEGTQDRAEAMAAAQAELSIHEQQCLYLGLWLADMQEEHSEGGEAEEEYSEEAGGGPEAQPKDEE